MIKGNFIGLLGARGAKLTVGLAILFFYARIFGASATYDSWIWALGVVNAVGMMVFGPIVETIRASYSTIENKNGRSAAGQYIATVAVMMIGGATFVATTTTLLLPALAEALLPQNLGHGYMAIFFVSALAPSLVLSQAVAIVTAHLNCQGKIYSPELAGTVGGVLGLALILIFPELPATWLLLGSYYLTLLVPLVAAVTFWPMLFRFISKLDWWAFRNHAHEALSLSAPLLMPYALGQILAVLELQYALQTGPGTLSILSYALFARNTVQAVFTAALSALAVPALARVWDPTDPGSFRLAFTHWAQQCLMLATVGMTLLFGFSDLVPLLLFGSNVTVEHQALLGELLRFYAIAITAVVLFVVAGSGLLAARRAKIYAAYGALACVISIMLLIVLFPKIGVVAIPLGLAVSHSVAAGMMLRAINPSDSWKIIGSAGARMTIILTLGSVLRGCDVVMAETFNLAERFAASVLIGVISIGIWWVVEHLVRRGAAHLVPKI
jgi:peptidoglycan biosynthesis protein MviN/MurJ (putative lipid II flippase)